jgi:hypothetical protein
MARQAGWIVLLCVALGWPYGARAQTATDAEPDEPSDEPSDGPSGGASDGASTPDSSSADAGPDLSALEEHVQYARYPEAVAAAEQLLDGQLTARQRIHVLELQATALIAQRDEERVQAVLTELYRRDPGHRFDDPAASPLVREAFEEAAQDAVAMPLEFEVHGPERLPDGAARLTVELGEGADAVHEVQLAYRTADADEFSRLTMTATRLGAYRAQFPLPSREVEIAYYIEIRAPSGSVLASEGTEDEPVEADVAADGSISITYAPERTVGGADGGGGVGWLFWTILAVAVVAGGGVATYFILSREGEAPVMGNAMPGVLTWP